MARKTLLLCAAATLAFAGAAQAQILGGGVGGSVGGTVGGISGSVTGGAMGQVGAPDVMGPVGQTTDRVGRTAGRAKDRVDRTADRAVDRARAAKDRTASTVRGAADVLPDTAASANGAVNGSASTSNAMANAAAGAGADANAMSGLSSGTMVRDASGANVGRVLRTVQAPDGSARVVVRMGADTFTLPAASLSMSGDVAVSSMTKAQLRARARGSAG